MKKTRLLSLLALILPLAAMVYMLVTAYRTDFLPVRLVVIIVISLVILLIAITFLILRAKKNAWVIVGAVLCLLLAAAFVFVTLHYVKPAENLARKSFADSSEYASEATEKVTIRIYMRPSDSEEERKFSPDMAIGMLEGPETNQTIIAELEKQYGQEIRFKEYEDVSKLLKAWKDEKIDAIVYYGDFKEMIKEYLEGAENDDPESQTTFSEDQLFILDSVEHKLEIEVKKPGVTKKPTKADAGNTGSEPEADNRSFVVLLSGIDTRTDEMVDKSRSDVNIIAVINPDTHQVVLVTTPRDYFVPLKFPDYITYKPDKLTHAGMYGVQVCMDTLGMLYDIDIDYYFRVNFAGFIEIVDALGGVTVEVEKEFSTTEYTYPAGPNELKGYKALSFVRNRFGIGDQARGRNQVAFVKAVIDKALSSDMLFNFNSILKAVEGSFETSMPYDLLSTLIREQLDTGAEWNVVTYAVTGFNSGAIPYSMDINVYVLEPDYETVDIAKDLMQKVLRGETVEQPKYGPEE